MNLLVKKDLISAKTFPGISRAGDFVMNLSSSASLIFVQLLYINSGPRRAKSIRFAARKGCFSRGDQQPSHW